MRVIETIPYEEPEAPMTPLEMLKNVRAQLDEAACNARQQGATTDFELDALPESTFQLITEVTRIAGEILRFMHDHGEGPHA